VRNKKWYLVILKDKTMAWAYEYIIENLKRPSFVYEPQNAYAAYKEVFGVDFKSPEQMMAESQEQEIARLKAELEAMKVDGKKSDGTTETFENGTYETGGDTDSTAGNTTNTVVYLTKEEFKTAHPELKGLAVHHKWQAYVKEQKEKK
jgi:hypothetical protein